MKKKYLFGKDFTFARIYYKNLPGIYIHIPFCKKACNYCDFHFSTSLEGKTQMVDAICKELQITESWLQNKKLKSIYFGGGTPSLLTAHEVDLILKGIDNYFSIEEGAEITIEVNPDDVNITQLKEWKSLGINRLSIGVQSFNDEELRWMNRAHASSQSVTSVKQAQDCGFDNITIDLIYGSKFQNLSGWEKTLEKAVALSTTHISAYNLTIENKTVLGLKNKKGKEPAVDEELSRKEFLMMSSFLKQEGFFHYEISNFGKPGYFAVHNSNYWLGEHYLGLGPSAHSYNGVSRKWNVSNNSLYLKGINNAGDFSDIEILTLENKYNEYVLTRLRTIWGCDSMEIQKLFGTRIHDHFLQNVSGHSKYLIKNKTLFTLNDEGKLKADGIAAALFI